MSIQITDANRAVWVQRLAVAEAALDKLMIGQSATAIGYDGESINYKPANESRLRIYIGQMQNALGLSNRPSRPRARRVSFR